MKLNPKCELVGIKTDCLVYNNITTEPLLSNDWGGVKNVMSLLLKNAR